LTTEHEILLTGIGGQGIQLAGTALGTAAMLGGLEVLLLSSYTGAMRGGQSDVTVVLGDGPITTPPVVSSAWGAIVLHEKFAGEALSKVRPDGVVFADAALVSEQAVASVGQRRFRPDITAIAAASGAPAAATLVMLGYFARVTGLVAVDHLVEAMESIVPPYRAERRAENETAIRAGFAAASADESLVSH
jgi:Pyruvate/2-oxoacid:ferredoxin oxidoreductase gamma subunit